MPDRTALHRRRSDHYSFIQRNSAILLWAVGGLLASLLAFGHLEQHVWDLQKQVDRNESRLDYHFGKQ